MQISDLKKRRLFLQNGLPLGGHWGAQICNIGLKCLPRAPLGPIPKNVSKYVAFLTLQTLENQAPAPAGAQFSLRGPTPPKIIKLMSQNLPFGEPLAPKTPTMRKIRAPENTLKNIR